MKIYDPRALASTATGQLNRAATALVHDAADARIVLFRIESGQEVPVHTSPSTVLLSIVAGSGIVAGAEGERAVRAGDLVAYDPGESHGMRAGDEQLVIAAIIAPRPGTR
ncbi:MAG TPA: cupin domain-containing protein [Gemmatimonadaceae bacterium]|nr:cupin domain-containing protein [Gemmatimonadaceae bacterium]